jgi:hypothetical protein
MSWNLQKDNYYSQEADKRYFSCSQYESFLQCEAAAMAKIYGTYQPKETDALIVGKYFHAYFEGKEEFEEFKQANFDEIFKTKTDKKSGEVIITGKYAKFEAADIMIQTAENDPKIQELIAFKGENEKVMEGKLFGIYPWKIRLDKYVSDPFRLIIDWKTVADIWKNDYNIKTGQRESFVVNYGYLMRAAVYTEIEKQFTGKDTDAPFWLVCISKQDPPDKEIINLSHRQALDFQLEEMRENMLKISAIKKGVLRPKRCGHCEYCRMTKRITDVIDYWKLDPGHRNQAEEDYVSYSDLQG